MGSSSRRATATELLMLMPRAPSRTMATEPLSPLLPLSRAMPTQHRATPLLLGALPLLPPIMDTSKGCPEC